MKVDKSFLFDNIKPFYNNSTDCFSDIQSSFLAKDYYSYLTYCEEPYLYHEREVYDLKDILSTINTLRQKSFFRDLSIRTPYILNQTKSLKRSNNNTDLLKLSTRLARSGKKITAIQLLSKSIFLILLDIKRNFLPFYKFLTFKNFLFLTSVSYFNKSSLTRLIKIFDVNFNYDNFIFKDELTKFEDFLPQNLINTSFKKFDLLFSFYIYKVDKKIFKNSRGRSGKYTFVWKYVAPYKRRVLISHWLMKEVRVAPGKKLKERVHHIFKKFILSPKETLAWKVNKFSTNYVYYHLRKSLGESCKTIMR